MKKKREFSKSLLIQESVLIWINTICILIMAFHCVIGAEFGDLPWLTAMTAFPWSAYSISQMFYYKKAAQENVLKIQGGNKEEEKEETIFDYEDIIEDIRKAKTYQDIVSGDNLDYSFEDSSDDGEG